jgi:hypothetical protein
VVAKSEGVFEFDSIGELGARYAGRFIKIILPAIFVYYVYSLSKLRLMRKKMTFPRSMLLKLEIP